MTGTAWLNQLVLWITESTKINKFVYCPIQVNRAFSLQHMKYLVYKYCIHLLFLTDESIYENHHLTPPHRNYIHRMNDNIRRLDVYIHTQPLPICHAYPLCAYKTGPKDKLSFRLSNICSHWGYIQVQTSLIVEQNSAKHTTEDEQVLGDIQVALSARTCPSKLI